MINYIYILQGLLHRNGIVAVKRLSQTAVINEKNFRQEVQSLIGVKHENIVRFLGYCSETQENVIKLDGNVMFPEDRQRLLCFEFMPNGSLDKYINNGMFLYHTRACIMKLCFIYVYLLLLSLLLLLLLN